MQAVDLSSVARLGVLGGTFDPIHFGHLAMAEAARERYALDAVLFVPAGVPPHKARGLSDAEHRYLMTVLATVDHPRFTVSRIEIDRSSPSYTAETLRMLHADYPQAELHLIIGGDMALDFPTWRDPQAIMDLAQVVAVTRPGVPDTRLRGLVETPAMARIALLDMPGMAISSSELRARARDGRSLRYLTPDPVADYIAKAGLYR